MNSYRVIGILIISLLFTSVSIGQEQIKILDESSKLLGRFKTQLFQNKDGRLKRLRGDVPEIKAEAEEAELILRLESLDWSDDENKDEVVIGRANIRLSDPKNMILSSELSRYKLVAGEEAPVDIKFKVTANGSYSLSIPFTAGKVESKFVQSFEVEEIIPTAKVGKPIGAIADIKKEWKETNKENSDDVEAFIEKYEKNQLAIDVGLISEARQSLDQIGSEQNDQSRAMIETSYEVRRIQDLLVNQGNNVYSFDLSSLDDELEISFSHPNDFELYDNGGNTYSLKVLGSKNYTIYVYEKGANRKNEVYLNNEFKAKLNKDNDDLIFSISGGVSPYTIEFVREGEMDPLLEARFVQLEANEGEQIIITYDMMASQGMDGRYVKAIIRDFTTDAEANFPLTDVYVEPKSKSLKFILIGLVVLIVAGGGYMVFFSQKKNAKREEYLAKAKAMQQKQRDDMAEVSRSAQFSEKSAPIDPPAPTTTPSQSKAPPRKITISKNVRRNFGPHEGSSYVPSGKMKITKRQSIGGLKTKEEFAEILKGDRYAFMDLEELWPDTAVKELFLSKECVKSLGRFLTAENLDKAIMEMEGAIPEVGGFLMGYHNVNEKTGQLRVTMDEFVPFVPEYHDVFKIEIGTATLVQELGDAQDSHPDKDVIGWFHTHPGHGLFLSNSDLSVQRHFPQKFQIAMEIDSLTKTLDTAFFTRKMDGTINNVEHRRKGAKWFSWKKIENI